MMIFLYNQTVHTKPVPYQPNNATSTPKELLLEISHYLGAPTTKELPPIIKDLYALSKVQRDVNYRD